MLIVLEGPDAVGKCEMSTRLTEVIPKTKGRASTRISFPRYETSLGKAILRHLKSQISMQAASTMMPSGLCSHNLAPEDALAFQCMMVADKYHAAAEISGFLRSNVDVVCDRYWQSAYAFGGSDGLDEQWLLDVHEMMPKPDVNILLSLSPEKALERRPQMRDRYEMDRETQVRVRANYLRLWTREASKTPKGWPSRWHIVDASRTRDEVFRDVMDIYDAALMDLVSFPWPDLKAKSNYVMGAGRYQEAPGFSLVGGGSGRTFEIRGRGAQSMIAYYDGQSVGVELNVSLFGQDLREGRVFPVDGTPE